MRNFGHQDNCHANTSSVSGLTATRKRRTSAPSLMSHVPKTSMNAARAYSMVLTPALAGAARRGSSESKAPMPARNRPVTIGNQALLRLGRKTAAPMEQSPPIDDTFGFFNAL